MLGHAAETGLGVVGFVGGVGTEAGGVALDLTGVGAVAGVPANVAGGALIVGGGLAAIDGGWGLGKDLNAMMNEADSNVASASPDDAPSDEALEIAKHALARSKDGSVDSLDHVIPDVDGTVEGYAKYADSVMDREGVTLGYRGSDDSTAYWDDQKGAIIIVSTRGRNTMFIPQNGFTYFTDNFKQIGTNG